MKNSAHDDKPVGKLKIMADFLQPPARLLEQMRAVSRRHALEFLEKNQAPGEGLTEKEAMDLANEAKHKTRNPKNKSGRT